MAAAAPLKVCILSGPSMRKNTTTGNEFFVWTGITSSSTMVSMCASTEVPSMKKGAYLMFIKYGLSQAGDYPTLNVGSTTRVLPLGAFSYNEEVAAEFLHAKFRSVADAAASPEKIRFSVVAVPIEISPSRQMLVNGRNVTMTNLVIQDPDTKVTSPVTFWGTDCPQRLLKRRCLFSNLITSSFRGNRVFKSSDETEVESDDDADVDEDKKVVPFQMETYDRINQDSVELWNTEGGSFMTSSDLFRKTYGDTPVLPARVVLATLVTGRIIDFTEVQKPSTAIADMTDDNFLLETMDELIGDTLVSEIPKENGRLALNPRSRQSQLRIPTLRDDTSKTVTQRKVLKATRKACPRGEQKTRLDQASTSQQE